MENGEKTEKIETCMVANEKEVEAVTSPFEIKETNFSSFIRLIRTTAWARRFVNNIRKKNATLTGPLNATEIQESMDSWIVYIQRKNFSDIFQALTNTKQTRVKNNLINQLGLKVDEDSLRCSG